jgi:hypothetical protein
VRWIDAAAHALALAFDLPARACQILRLALAQAFIEAGADPGAPWSEEQPAPTLEDVIAVMLHELARDETSVETRQLIRDGCLPGLRELALLPATALFQPLPALTAPVIVPIEQVGGQQMVLARTALACASAITALERAARSPSSDPPRAVLFLVEPHHLLPHKRADDQPFLPFIEGLRQVGGSLMLATALPHLIDREMLAAGIIGAQHLTHADAIALAQHLMRLKDRELRRLTNLAAGEMLWQHDGRTILVSQPIPTYLEIEAPTSGGVV